MASVNGTFSGTGQSDTMTATKITVKLNFAGTASVDIEAQMHDDSWIKIMTGITADYLETFDPGGIPETIRLNCTAHTDNVVYELKSNAIYPSRGS
ncbi:hypothetical protein [Pseudohoeflea coraliihabitans]|uniref:Uncharacterized protein n=1 Tax=Pseudohoeflea coraliihabitans TaxID=2860393 RepID=A0ABS6WUU9_9HYPH|nr:hypothetical protein [Pseudohoeflea sp. DP4N28-3]MBW3099222.1 hypothetical protein [Pseudohoeflea sp. DP4N28-3]